MKYIWLVAIAVCGCNRSDPKPRVQQVEGSSESRVAVQKLVMISPTFVNLGASKLNSEIPFEISFKNITACDVVIEQVTASCSCTNMRLAKNLLKPGESTLASGMLKTPLKAGHFKQTISIKMRDDTRAQEEIVRISTDVKAEMHVSCEAVTLLDDDRMASFEVVNRSGTPVDLTSISTSNSLFTAKISTTHLLPEENSIITVQASSAARLAAEGEIIISTSHNTEDRIVVPVRYRARPPIQTIPEKLNLGLLSKAKGDLNKPYTIRMLGEKLLSHDIVLISKPTGVSSVAFIRREKTVIDAMVSLDATEKASRLSGVIIFALIEPTRPDDPKVQVSVPLSALIAE